MNSNTITTLYNKGILVKEGFALFYAGPFSNWYKCKFIIDGVTYSTSEQHMMLRKAVTFNDYITASKILKTSDAKKQKALGRLVNGYDDDVWNNCRYQAVLEGCLAKFEQNLDIRQLLLSTEDLELVEASPFDVIWGIGMDASHPDATNKAKWKGQNLLGKVLVEVRETLRPMNGLNDITRES
jgi:hypothetical protein